MKIIIRTSAVILAVGMMFSSTDVWGDPCGFSWFLEPPQYVYRDGHIRIAFSVEDYTEFSECWLKFTEMATVVPVQLLGESEPTSFNLQQYFGSSFVIQDWAPSGGWKSRKRADFPLIIGIHSPGDCYPPTPAGFNYISFDILDSDSPPVEPVELKLLGAEGSWAENSITIGVSSSGERELYLVDVGFDAQNETKALILNSDGRSITVSSIGACEMFFSFLPCSELRITTTIIGLNGHVTDVSNEIDLTLGVPKGQYEPWHMGEPLGCITPDLDGGTEDGTGDAGYYYEDVNDSAVDSNIEDASQDLDATMEDTSFTKDYGAETMTSAPGCGCISVAL